MPGFEAFFRRPPFHDIAAVDQMLTDCGYEQVTTVTREVTTVVRHPGAVVGDVPVPGPRARWPGGTSPKTTCPRPAVTPSPPWTASATATGS